MEKPSQYHKNGYTCGEAIIKAYNEKNNKNIPISLGSGMGTGFTVGSTCGAVGAAAVIIGYEKGRSSNEEENEARKLTRQFMENIKEKYSTITCKELKQNKVTCEQIIEASFENLNKLL